MYTIFVDRFQFFDVAEPDSIVTSAQSFKENTGELTPWPFAVASPCIFRQSCHVDGALQGSAHRALGPIAFGIFEGLGHLLKVYGGELGFGVISYGLYNSSAEEREEYHACYAPNYDLRTPNERETDEMAR